MSGACRADLLEVFALHRLLTNYTCNLRIYYADNFMISSTYFDRNAEEKNSVLPFLNALGRLFVPDMRA